MLPVEGVVVVKVVAKVVAKVVVVLVLKVASVGRFESGDMKGAGWCNGGRLSVVVALWWWEVEVGGPIIHSG